MTDYPAETNDTLNRLADDAHTLGMRHFAILTMSGPNAVETIEAKRRMDVANELFHSAMQWAERHGSLRDWSPAHMGIRARSAAEVLGDIYRRARSDAEVLGDVRQHEHDMWCN